MILTASPQLDPTVGADRSRMPTIGPMEMLIVLAIAVMVLGPRKLPEAGRSLGRGIREFKDAIAGVTTIDESKTDAER
jgi:sec-independent protein translocase protein TatA